MNLKEAAAAVDVHYMTAYRYVRTGRPPARRVRNGWVVEVDDLATFAGRDVPGAGRSGKAGHGADWRDRLRRTLLVGDETRSVAGPAEQALGGGGLGDAEVLGTSLSERSTTSAGARRSPTAPSPRSTRRRPQPLASWPA